MKKMIALFCVLLVFIGIPIAYLYKIGFKNYLDLFFLNQMIPLMGTIMALNFALAASLQAILINMETIIKQKTFANSRKEINHNLLFMMILFGLVFILQIFNCPNSTSILFILNSLKITLFAFYFYAVYEISTAIYKVSTK